MALCCRASLWHRGMASWVLEGQHFQEFTLQIVFERYQHYLEEACTLLSSAAVAPPLYPGAQQSQEPWSLPGSGLWAGAGAANTWGGVLLGEDTPAVWSLRLEFKARSDLSCHVFGTQMTEVSLNACCTEEK